MNVIGYTEYGSIEIELDGVRWIVPDDMSNRYRRMIAEWESEGNTIPPYVLPVVLNVPTEISDRQFFHILAKMGLITQSEALAAVKTGDLPAALEAYVSSLPEEEEFDVRMLLEGATVFRRDHPLTASFGAFFGMTSEQIDNVFIEGAML